MNTDRNLAVKRFKHRSVTILGSMTAASMTREHCMTCSPRSRLLYPAPTSWFQSSVLLRWFVHSSLPMRAMVIGFIFPPHPDFLECRRNPYAANDDAPPCPAASGFDGFKAASDAMPGGEYLLTEVLV